MSDLRSFLVTAREVLAEVNRGGPRVVTFTRGLALGALVGAAIAGSAMLDRRSRARRSKATEDAKATTPD